MRLTTVILIASLMQVSAAGFAQKISLSAKNASLSQIFKKIKSQAGVDFLITADLLKNTNNVTIEVKNTELSEVLDRIFKEQQLTYVIEDKFVVVSKKDKPSFLEDVITRFQTIDVRGKVVDQNGQPLPGATIKIKGTTIATTSDANGDFYLPRVDEGSILLIAFIGFAPVEVPANPEMGSINMTDVNAKLDEVQVIAYGTTTQRFSTSSNATVKADDIMKQPVSNPLLTLQGRVAGLFVSQVSGANGADINITIQGQNSLQIGNSPLYVIDDIPYSPQFTNNTLAINALGGRGSSFNFVNPAEIESISILKDADATAIYGSRAANGAILITTKKGKIGKTKVDLNIQNGWGNIDHKLKLLNTEQYLEMRKEAYKNDGLLVPTPATSPATSRFDLTVWDQNRYTDWQKVLVGGTAQFTDLQASISGGTASTQFRAGYGFNRQTTVYPNSLSDTKGSIHFNLNHNSTDNRFKYTLSANYLQDRNLLNGIDLMDIAINLAPNAPTLYNADGTLNWEPYPKNPNSYSFQNPMGYAEQRFTGNTSNLIANNIVSYEILTDVQAKVSMGYNKLLGDETNITPITYFRPDLNGKNRSASYLTKSISSWIVEPQLLYRKKTDYGAIEGLLGATFQENRSNVLEQAGSGYTDDSQLLNILAASTVNIGTVSKSLYKYNAIFARINYRLYDKYIFNLTARRDGSSRFGDANKLHTFFAVAGAWLFGDEDIIKRNLPWLSSGKIRVNYGTTGNDQIDDYTYQSLLETYRVDRPYQGGTGIYPTSIYNPYLQWEETKKLNLGINLSFLKNRIDLDLNYFHNSSSNQLVSYLLPSTTGFSAITQNFAATVQNTGLEASLTITPIRSKNFNWQSSINFTNPKNKLIAFADLENSTYADMYVVGQPINVIKSYKFEGVNSTTGLYEFLNSKGEKTSSPSATSDRTVLIDPNPNWYGGLVNSFQYKGFDLSFLVQVVSQMAPNYRFGNYVGSGGRSTGNQPISVLDRWKSIGDIARNQMFSTTGNLTRDPETYVSGSDANFSGASYLRLKNASISYNIPETWISAVHLSGARVYIQGQNLLTISDFIGTDPETKLRNYLPPLRMYTLGVQVTF